jgi:hemin uptake protein HemP
MDKVALPTQPSQVPTSAVPSALPVVDSSVLLQGGRELLIRHNGDHYRLRLTQAGKLILTK